MVIWGVALVVVQFLLFTGLAAGLAFLERQASVPGADAELISQYQDATQDLVLTPEGLAEKTALFQGSWTGITAVRLERLAQPFIGAVMFGWETLGYMLFGMAALKSGFFRGEWSVARYRKWALICLLIAVPVYAALAWLLTRDGFSVPMILATVMVGTTPFRPLMVIAYAALIIVLTRNGGALVERIAAAGRAAFTNYLGTSIVMTTLFYGYGVGLYGSMTRIELWLPVVGMWALMLLWSKPWLDRFRYGPFEWLWRSLARMRLEPMSRTPRPLAAAE
jgi:uncharacterized protein